MSACSLQGQRRYWSARAKRLLTADLAPAGHHRTRPTKHCLATTCWTRSNRRVSWRQLLHRGCQRCRCRRINLSLSCHPWPHCSCLTRRKRLPRLPLQPQRAGGGQHRESAPLEGLGVPAPARRASVRLGRRQASRRSSSGLSCRGKSSCAVLRRRRRLAATAMRSSRRDRGVGTVGAVGVAHQNESFCSGGGRITTKLGQRCLAAGTSADGRAHSRTNRGWVSKL